MSVIGITGSNGQLGSRAIEFLIENKFAGKIVALSRDPSKTKKTIAENKAVEVRKADFEKDDEATLTQAFASLDRLLVISTDAVGQRVPQHLKAFNAAKSAGVKHIIYTSLTSAHSSLPFIFFQEHIQSEEALKGLGVGYTILRNNFYTELFVGGDKAPVTNGHPVLSLGNGRIGYVSREDCARAAAAALASNSTESKTYDITGPEALSGEDVAKIYSEVLKKDVKTAIVSGDQYQAILEGAGVPAFLIPVFRRIQELAQEKLFDAVSGDVELLTGKKPISYKEVSTSILL